MLWTNPIEIGHWVGLKDLTDLHNDWLRSFLYNDEDQTLQAHRGSYKTTTLSLFFALHAIIKPNETLIYLRKTNPDVMEIARQTANILSSGCIQEIVRILYGEELRFTRLNATEVSTNLATGIKGAPQILGLGIGTSITGKHADIVVTDDIVNTEDRYSKAERDKTKRAYQELQNVRNRGGRIINTGTPWHKDDAFTLMPNIAKFDYKSTGLISDDDIKALRDSMLPSLFAANYELKHIAGEDVLFTDPQTGASPSLVNNGLAHVDSAFYGEDFTAFTMMAKHGDKYYVLGKMWRKHVEDCYVEIQDLYSKHLAPKLYNETNADKGMVAKELRQMGMKVVTYNESMNKHVKIATYLYSIWKDVVFVEGTDDEYIAQICDYTEDAEHDDAPDSCACLARLFLKKGNSDYKPLWN